MPDGATTADILDMRYADRRTLLHELVTRRTPPSGGKTALRDVSYELLARSLVRFGADVDARDSRGYTPLHLAAARGDLHMVNMLLDMGADCDAQNADGDTVLYVATYWSQVDVIRTLLRRGANPSIANKQGKTPMTMAMQLNKPAKVLQALVTKRCCPRRPAFKAALAACFSCMAED